MLSVSNKYLALGEVYLPIRAAFPNYPTLRNISYRLDSSEDRAFTFSGVLSKALMMSLNLPSYSIDYNSTTL